jgi:hypothetical protein
VIGVLADAYSPRVGSSKENDLGWKPPSHSDQREKHRGEWADGLDNDFGQI